MVKASLFAGYSWFEGVDTYLKVNSVEVIGGFSEVKVKVIVGFSEVEVEVIGGFSEVLRFSIYLASYLSINYLYFYL